jgi:hypothetical protein
MKGLGVCSLEAWDLVFDALFESCVILEKTRLRELENHSI